MENDRELVLSTEIDAEASCDEMLLAGVWKAIHSPAVDEPRRPKTVFVSSEEQRSILAPRLESLGIDCVATTDMDRIRSLIDDLTSHLGGNSSRKSLLKSPGVTPTLLGHFFDAADRFYRARPWRSIEGDSILRIACDHFKSGPWYAVVMGQSGIEQGLALYEDLELLRLLVSGELSDKEHACRTSAISVTYGEAFDLAPEDVAAAKQHKWAVSGPDAYPCVMRINPGLALRTPLKWELELLEGSLRAIPDFLQRGATSEKLHVTISGDLVELEISQWD
jgi:hypothetical protein